jgi:hypothetical protein
LGKLSHGEQGGKPRPKTNGREGAQRAQKKGKPVFVFFALQSVRITHIREDFISRRERRERRETTEKKDKFRIYFISATSAPLRGTVPSGRVLGAACGAVFSCGKSLVTKTSRPNSRKSLISMIIPDNSR